MRRFGQGADLRQQTLLSECLEDDVAEDDPVAKRHPSTVRMGYDSVRHRPAVGAGLYI